MEEYYDDLERMCMESIVLTPNGQTVALNIPAGQWHTVNALESGTVILEVKDGRYEPMRGGGYTGIGDCEVGIGPLEGCCGAWNGSACP